MPRGVYDRSKDEEPQTDEEQPKKNSSSKEAYALYVQGVNVQTIAEKLDLEPLEVMETIKKVEQSRKDQ